MVVVCREPVKLTKLYQVWPQHVYESDSKNAANSFYLYVCIYVSRGTDHLPFIYGVAGTTVSKNF